MTLRQAPRNSSRALAVLLSVSTAASVCLTGCYQGEWRTGPEVPVAATTRLMPTRSIERWDLSQSISPYVVQVKGTVTPRCRHAMYGTSRRTDTGKFRKVGGSLWSALAITTGVAGGAAAGFGGSGWFSQSYPEIGRPTMYAAGAALAAVGLGSCIASIAKGTKLRYALCGILTGLGGAALGGAVVSSLPSTTMTVGSGASAMPAPLIPKETFLTLAIAGGALVGTSVFTGIIANVWRGYVDRVREVEIENTTSWDPQSGEVSCGRDRPLSGRTMTLEITSEFLSEGPGSELAPLKMHVAVGQNGLQSVDLRGLRQGLPSCGALTVRMSPDILYEAYADEYTPPVGPEQINSTFKPIHGQLEPKEGIQLPGLELRPRGERKPPPVPGISPETMAMVERRCRRATGLPVSPPGSRTPLAGAGPRTSPPPLTEPSRPELQGPPEAQVQLSRPALPSAPTAQLQQAAPPPVPSTPSTPSAPAAPSEPDTAQAPSAGAAGITPQRRAGGGDREDGECSAEAHKARFADCEHQCAKALEISPCLFEFRKCHLDARFSAQPQKDRDACDLTWEQCLFKVNIAPGSWRRCVDGCQQANEPPSCRR